MIDDLWIPSLIALILIISIILYTNYNIKNLSKDYNICRSYLHGYKDGTVSRGHKVKLHILCNDYGRIFKDIDISIRIYAWEEFKTMMLEHKKDQVEQ